MTVSPATGVDSELPKSVLTKSVRTESVVEIVAAGVEENTDFTKTAKVKEKSEIEIEKEEEKEK